MIPQVLSFITTYKCNFSCDHCSVGDGPDRSEVLMGDIVQKAIEQADTLPSIRVIVFTGGESTLHKENGRWLVAGMNMIVRKSIGL